MTSLLERWTIAGLSTGAVFMPITATALAGVEPEHAGAASGMLQTTQQLGSAVGVAVIVSVYAANAVPGEFLPGLTQAFLTSALFSGIAGVIATSVWFLRRRPVAGPEPEEAGVGARAGAACPPAVPGGGVGDNADGQRGLNAPAVVHRSVTQHAEAAAVLAIKPPHRSKAQ